MKNKTNAYKTIAISMLTNTSEMSANDNCEKIIAQLTEYKYLGVYIDETFK